MTDAHAVDGLAEAYSLFDQIPEAAREELGVELEAIAGDVLAAQKRDVAKRTGALEAALSMNAQIEQLRVRVGLLGIKGGRSKLFYGRIVEAGRRAQAVSVTRSTRRRPYKMRVSALAARPFVRVDRPEIRADQRLANFWSNVLAQSRGGN